MSLKTGAGLQVPRSSSATRPAGEDAGQVLRQTAAGDVREGAHIGFGDQGQAVLGIDLGGLQQLLAEGTAELLDMSGELHAVDIQQHLAGQGVTVGVQTRGAHTDDHIAGADAIRAEHGIGLDHADAGAGDVVVVRAHQARVFGGLAAEQGAAGQDAAFGDTGDDLGDALGDDLADGDVVLQEQRFGTADDEVVDDHGDQVEADGVVLVHGLRDGDLGADAVGGGGQQRLLVSALQREQSGEAAESTLYFGPGSLLGQRREQLYRAVASFDIHSGRCVRSTSATGCLFSHCRGKLQAESDG